MGSTSGFDLCGFDWKAHVLERRSEIYGKPLAGFHRGSKMQTFGIKAEVNLNFMFDIGYQKNASFTLTLALRWAKDFG